MVDNNDDGLKRVKNGSFAYFMESTSLEYFTQRDCEVSQVGDLIDERNYAIGMRKSRHHKRIKCIKIQVIYFSCIAVYFKIINIFKHWAKEFYDCKNAALWRNYMKSGGNKSEAVENAM